MSTHIRGVVQRKLQIANKNKTGPDPSGQYRLDICSLIFLENETETYFDVITLSYNEGSLN